MVENVNVVYYYIFVINLLGDMDVELLPNSCCVLIAVYILTRLG